MPVKFIDASRAIEKFAGVLEKTSNAAHIRQIAFAYAYYVAYRQHPELDDWAVERPRDFRSKLTTRDPLLIIVRRFIRYGVREAADPSPRKLSSRDANAIRHLFKRGIKPSQVVQLSKQPGEGVNHWSRTHRRPVAGKVRIGRPGSLAKLRPRDSAKGAIYWIRKLGDDEAIVRVVEVQDEEMATLLLNLAEAAGKYLSSRQGDVVNDRPFLPLPQWRTPGAGA